MANDEQARLIEKMRIASQAVTEIKHSVCPHRLSTIIFCRKCWVEKHGEPEPFDKWSIRVSINSIALANEEESAEIWAEAEKWIANSPSKERYSRIRYDAKSVLAEYLANQRGLTLWQKN